MSKLFYDIKNIDYKVLLSQIQDKSIDFICIDPPYGKIKGMKLSGQKRIIDWDTNINWDEMFEEFNRIIKDGGTIACFGQNPTYASMILSNIKDYKYELIWQKNNAAQGFHADKMPLIFTENIAIFIHNEKAQKKRTFNNIASEKEIDKNQYYCRWYAQQMFKWINKPRRGIHHDLGHRKLEFWFYFVGDQFGLLSEELYEQLISKYHINKWDKFIPYEELKLIWKKEKELNKGVRLDSSEYSKTFSNVLNVAKEQKYFHPTQKPVELMEKLILMYTKENDTVLDCFMGSGSTGIACLKHNRNFIGCELDEEYYQIAKKRIEETISNKF
ncbi:DNA-methyltransferase [Mycoplasmopsis verecunda]|uniref:Methyltransferase n=1 Tax=Mycoplasmopsis verecunda TaxID=171291 RepID=A0A1T4MF74_9BACT|nr:site-specific DNA-methyltransferase [Mycoplasmopsis verecunda]WPB54530.1 site-specific DNA-methyltransferase [Mycoplasmopsis verecunda]SJZ65592.1 DNA methylase [Mycoplasmopsis verecunda]